MRNTGIGSPLAVIVVLLLLAGAYQLAVDYWVTPMQQQIDREVHKAETRDKVRREAYSPGRMKAPAWGN